MNILSSLLYFLGQTVGDDPSNLTTTSKTIVGAVNEVNSKMHISDQNPTALDGNNGDIWLVYETQQEEVEE